MRRASKIVLYAVENGRLKCHGLIVSSFANDLRFHLTAFHDHIFRNPGCAIQGLEEVAIVPRSQRLGKAVASNCEVLWQRNSAASVSQAYSFRREYVKVGLNEWLCTLNRFHCCRPLFSLCRLQASQVTHLSFLCFHSNVMIFYDSQRQ